MPPTYLVIDRIKVGVGAIRRPQIWRNAGGCWLLKKSHSVACPVCRCAVLLKDEEIAWHVMHHGQQLLWQEHVAVIAAVDLHPRSTKTRSVGQALRCRGANLNVYFPQVARQHTLGVVGNIIWLSFTIYSSFQRMKEFWKSVTFWQSYRHIRHRSVSTGFDFGDTVYLGQTCWVANNNCRKMIDRFSVVLDPIKLGDFFLDICKQKHPTCHLLRFSYIRDMWKNFAKIKIKF